MLNFALCDDNKKILSKITKMLEDIFSKHNLTAKVSFQTTDSLDFLNYTKENSPDVLILDINLPSNQNGIQLAQEIRKFNKDCYIIFVTAHIEFVLLAYQCKTFDYIYKPFTCERLETSILRLFEDLNKSTSTKKYLKLNDKNTIIDENEILYIKRDGMKIIFHTNFQDYKIYSSFAKLKEHLPPNFVRCHKSFIVNKNNISKIETSSNLIYFPDNHKCDIGPKYKSTLVNGFKLYDTSHL